MAVQYSRTMFCACVIWTVFFWIASRLMSTSYSQINGNRLRENSTLLKTKAGNTTGNYSAELDWYRVRIPSGRLTQYPLTIRGAYIINNPNLCTNISDLVILTIVHSATYNFQKRDIMRKTWANINLFKNITSRIAFFLGLTKDKHVQTLIENEHLIHGDTIQGDFLDHYHNLTHKGVLAFRWVSEFCNHSKIVVKVDDDVFMNPFILLQEILPKYQNRKRFILCHSRPPGTSGIMRGVMYKWHVDKNVFKGYKTFPVTHCFGFFVIISSDIIAPLFHASMITPFFWIDDVYLYGLLPYKIGHVAHYNIQNTITRSVAHGKQCYSESQTCHIMVILSNDLNSNKEIWSRIMANLTDTQKRLVNESMLQKIS